MLYFQPVVLDWAVRFVLTIKIGIIGVPSTQKCEASVCKLPTTLFSCFSHCSRMYSDLKKAPVYKWVEQGMHFVVFRGPEDFFFLQNNQVFLS